MPPRRRTPALLLLSHGGFAAAARASAEEILGDLGDVFALTLARETPLSEFQGQIRRTVEENGPDRDWLILADLFGGSCANLAVRTETSAGAVPVLAGFNLAMVIEFVLHRETLPFSELVQKTLEAGRGAVLDVRARLAQRSE